MDKNDKNPEEVEDVVFEDEEESSNPQAVIKKLRAKLKECEAERMEYLTGWQKAKADFVNLRKKDEEDRVEFIKFAKAQIIEDFLPVLDSFNLAMQNKESWEALPKDWRIGMESIYNQLNATLSSHGVSKLGKAGETFDPSKEEAVQSVEVSEKEKDGVVMEVLQLGYSLNGKIIRPAKVKVGEYKN